MIKSKVRFQVLTAASTKIRALEHQGDDDRAAPTSETPVYYETTRRNILEGSNLQNQRCLESSITKLYWSYR
jgi:hypothetical protein